jgi:hypothetical protein
LLFQKYFNLKENSNILNETLACLNSQLEKLYKVFGYVTDDYSLPVGGLKVVLEQICFDGKSNILGESYTLSNGFFCIYPDISKYLNKFGVLNHKLPVKLSFYESIVTEDTTDFRLVFSYDKIFIECATAFLPKSETVSKK